MSRRVHPTFRKLLGLAAAPGRTLSALEPDARARTVLEADPGGAEDRVLERLAPLMTPASVASRLERTLTKLSPGAVEGETALSRVSVTRADGAVRERVSEGRTLELPFPSPPSAARGTRRPPRPNGRAGPLVVEARREDGEPARRVEQERLLAMAGLPGTEPASRPAETREAPGPVEALRGARRHGAPPLPSREEVRARFEQRARGAGAEMALETPLTSQPPPRAVAELLARGPAVASASARGHEPDAPAATPSSVERPLERVLERLESRGPTRARPTSSASPSEARGLVPGVRDSRVSAPEQAGGLAPAPRGGGAGGLTGLAGLAARVAAAATPAPRARTESHPPPPLLANTALPAPAIPSVLTERMEETKLAQRLERLLRREAERAGVSLEGLEP